MIKPHCPTQCIFQSEFKNSLSVAQLPDTKMSFRIFSFSIIHRGLLIAWETHHSRAAASSASAACLPEWRNTAEWRITLTGKQPQWRCDNWRKTVAHYSSKSGLIQSMPPLTQHLSPSPIMTNVMSRAGTKPQPVHVPIYCTDKHLAPLARGARMEMWAGADSLDSMGALSHRSVAADKTETFKCRFLYRMVLLFALWRPRVNPELIQTAVCLYKPVWPRISSSARGAEKWLDMVTKGYLGVKGVSLPNPFYASVDIVICNHGWHCWNNMDGVADFPALHWGHCFEFLLPPNALFPDLHQLWVTARSLFVALPQQPEVP